MPGKNRTNRQTGSIARRLVVLTLALIVLTCAVLGYLGIFFLRTTMDANIKVYKQAMNDGYKTEIKSQVESCIALMAGCQARAEAGEISEKEAQETAKEAIRAMRYREDASGYMWIDATDYTLIMHPILPDQEGDNREDLTDQNGVKIIQNVVKSAKAGGGYNEFYFTKADGVTVAPKLAYSELFEPWGWIVTTGNYTDDMEAEMQATEDGISSTFSRMYLIYGVFIAALLIVGTIFTVIFGNKLAGPIRLVTSDIDKMAGGDFMEKGAKERHDWLNNDNTEIGTMARAKEQLYSNIRGAMTSILDTISYVADSSEKLTASAQQGAEASDRVATSCTNVADACQNQMQASDEAKLEAEQFTATVSEFKDTIEDFGQLITSANDVAGKGSEEIEAAIVQMSKIQDSVSGISSVVSGLGDQMQAITGIVDTITEIASQTNLLSLNASIEAARAGEAGRGFAVVAGEINALADQSNEAAGRIADLIRNIQRQSDEAVEAMKEGLATVDSGTEVVQESGELFRNIADMVSEISERSSRMTEMVNRFAEGTAAISHAIDNIDEMNRNAVAETENASEASEQQALSAQEIAQAGEQLAKMASDLQEAVDRFEL